MSIGTMVLPEWCETCDEQRYFVVSDPEASHFLRCDSCGNLSTAVWCRHCGMGGDFLTGLAKRPLRWKCPTCRRQYHLPAEFYNAPIPLVRAEALPPQLRGNVPKQAAPRPSGPKSLNAALRSLSRPTAWILLTGFAGLLAIHITSLLTRKYFFPYPEAFFMLAMFSVYVGLVPANERISARDYYRQYIKPIHPLLRWAPFLIMLYALFIYFFLGGITAGRRLIDLPPAVRQTAQYSQVICIQGFLMGTILLGGLIRWHRSNSRPK